MSKLHLINVIKSRFRSLQPTTDPSAVGLLLQFSVVYYDDDENLPYGEESIIKNLNNKNILS